MHRLLLQLKINPFSCTRTFNEHKANLWRLFTYPEGKGEMRLYKVDVQQVGVVPLHFYEAPLTSHIEDGRLTLKTKKGKSTTFREGDSFVLSADIPPHTMVNNVKVLAVMWVNVAAAKEFLLSPMLKDK